MKRLLCPGCGSELLDCYDDDLYACVGVCRDDWRIRKL